MLPGKKSCYAPPKEKNTHHTPVRPSFTIFVSGPKTCYGGRRTDSPKHPFRCLDWMHCILFNCNALLCTVLFCAELPNCTSLYSTVMYWTTSLLCISFLLCSVILNTVHSMILQCTVWKCTVILANPSWLVLEATPIRNNGSTLSVCFSLFSCKSKYTL